MVLEVINPGIDTTMSSKLNSNYGFVSSVGRVNIVGSYSLNYGLIKWSDTRWQSIDMTTTDGGSSWSSGGYGQHITATNNDVRGIAINSATPSTCTYTSNSGASWSASSVTPANATSIYCASMADNSQVGVIGGVASSGNRMWYTTNGGNNWSQASTGSTTTIMAIAMATSTIGYAVDSSKNIWKTTDGGVNWTDTGDNALIGTTTKGIRIIIIDSDNMLITTVRSMILCKYTNSTNTVSYIINYQADTDNGGFTNFVKASNGNYYILFVTNVLSGSRPSEIHLWCYDGSYCYFKNCGLHPYSDPTASVVVNTAGLINCIITVDNTIVFNGGNHIITYNIEG